MAELDFFMPMHPPTATAQEKGHNNKTGAVYLKAAAKEAREKLLAHLAEHRPEEPLNGPIMLKVAWRFYSDTKAENQWHTNKPDTDNLLKDLKDCMTKLNYWKDDRQICVEYTEKRWTQTLPGIAIHAEELT